MGDVGLIAKAVETIFSAFIDEDKIPEIMKRRKLKSLKEECQRALINNDFVALADATARLRDFSSKP